LLLFIVTNASIVLLKGVILQSVLPSQTKLLLLLLATVMMMIMRMTDRTLQHSHCHQATTRPWLLLELPILA